MPNSKMKIQLKQITTTCLALIWAANTGPSFAIVYWQSDYTIVNSHPTQEPDGLLHPGRDRTALITGPGGGSGVVIAPNWIMTAGHVLDVSINAGTQFDVRFTVTINGTEHEYKVAAAQDGTPRMYRHRSEERRVGKE